MASISGSGFGIAVRSLSMVALYPCFRIKSRHRTGKIYFMSANTLADNETKINLRPVNGDNWRAVAKLKVTEPQREFVADPCYYLALCCYGDVWQPIAVCLSERVIGFLMWGVDAADGSCWLGGLLIDQAYQRQGYGRQAVEGAITMLAKRGYQHFALSYAPHNRAKQLYHSLGFSETSEWEVDEVVARLSLTATGAS